MSGIKQDVFMPTIEVYDVNQANVTQVDVDEKVFEKKIDESIYYEVVKMQMANARSGTACTKGRSDVRGGGKKTLETKREPAAHVQEHQVHRSGRAAESFSVQNLVITA